jgi:hypothetical protein
LCTQRRPATMSSKPKLAGISPPGRYKNPSPPATVCLAT